MIPTTPQGPSALPGGPRPVFVALWASGGDPTLDELVRIAAVRPAPATAPGAWERFERFCRPRDAQGRNAQGTAGQRVARELGVTRHELEVAAPAEQAWAELLDFAASGPLVVADGEAFDAWHGHLAGGEPPLSVALHEVAALCLPGRLASQREALVELLAPGVHGRAHEPEDLRAALFELARRVHALEPGALTLLSSGCAHAVRALAAADPAGARRVTRCLQLVDRPSLWSTGVGLDFGGLEDGRLAGLARADAGPDELLEGLEPAVQRAGARWAACEPLPCGSEEPLEFPAEDLRTLDDVFQVHLPAAFGVAGGASGYRASQHQVAREVARSLGARELLLVHAPTGTGKTLAYLVPAMLWARRHGVRIAVATYTRALQEQALDREVPRALAALARAGVAPGTLVSLLKGRENYLCWRALKLAPPDEESAEAWLAWTQLALFALCDQEGDLDRLPRRAPVRCAAPLPYQRALEGLLRAVRSQTGCCAHTRDRSACAAEQARKRAERSHVVLVNQAFALARPDFFKRIVFDECEHLHDQAHNAWSRALTLRELRQLVQRLATRRGGSRVVLDRLARQTLPDTPTGEVLERCAAACEAVLAAADELERECLAFDAWRVEELRTRPEHEQHFLMREYVERGPTRQGPTRQGPARQGPARHGEPRLVEVRTATVGAVDDLDVALALLAERLSDAPVRGAGGLRRALDTARGELDQARQTLKAWIPVIDGAPQFVPSFFYDVERERGELGIAARVLLPQEVLGSVYYPTLDGAVFLSATTWIQGGFEAASAYLGLDRAARPAASEARPGSELRRFRAPDVFDWSRVLVAVPKDAPPVRDKAAFLDYVRRFVGHVAERTRGRMLVLFTNAQDMRAVGLELAGFFRARRIPFWFQNQEGTVKEELSDLFRARVDSVLMGVDTFWYGADFPGETLEYLVIVKLPYGVPDRYHDAQCAAIGRDEQRRQIYMPRALSKFRQGFGRLMRRESDRGCVFVLDGRALDARHRAFLRELPLLLGAAAQPDEREPVARFLAADTERCVHEALAHMQMLADVRRRGLEAGFAPAPEGGPGRASGTGVLRAEDG